MMESPEACVFPSFFGHNVDERVPFPRDLQTRVRRLSREPNRPESDPPSVDELIADAMNGDTEARGRLIDQCRDYLLLVANQEMDADLKRKLGPSDLVQESMLSAYACFDRFDGRTERDFLAWIKGILGNEMRHTRREFKGVKKRQIGREAQMDGSAGVGIRLTDPYNTPRRDAVQKEQAAALQQAMQRLPANYQEVLQLRNWQHLSFEEIAQRTDRSVDAARKLWYRAVLKLKTELKASD